MSAVCFSATLRANSAILREPWSRAAANTMRVCPLTDGSLGTAARSHGKHRDVDLMEERFRDRSEDVVVEFRFSMRAGDHAVRFPFGGGVQDFLDRIPGGEMEGASDAIGFGFLDHFCQRCFRRFLHAGRVKVDHQNRIDVGSVGVGQDMDNAQLHLIATPAAWRSEE